MTIFFAVLAGLISFATVAFLAIHSARVKRFKARTPAERTRDAWNEAYPPGNFVAIDPESTDEKAGRVAVRTRGRAYVKDGRAVIDVDRLGTIVLDNSVTALGKH